MIYAVAAAGCWWNGLVAGVADHEGLAPHPGHERRPRRLVCAELVELGELADLVDLHLGRL